MQNSHPSTSGTIKDLVIYPQLDEIHDLIRQHPVCAVIAETGSGKSLGIPFKMASVGLRICISVPTITAALSLAARQKQLCQIAGLKCQIGYAVEGQKHYTKHTQIIYGTSGHWRRKLLRLHIKDEDGTIKWQPITFCDLFILDEVHTGSLDNDIILSLLQNAREAGIIVPKLVLSTATYNKQKFAEIPMLTLTVPSYPVEIKYHHQDYTIEDERLCYDLILKICDMHKSDPELKLGHFLVFVPGANDVEEIITYLTDLLSVMEGYDDSLQKQYSRRRKHEDRENDDYQDDEQEIKKTSKQEFIRESIPTPGQVALIPAYARLQGHELAKIYDPVPDGIRKIIVATNVAETSITVPGVGGVFCSTLEKRAATSTNGGLALVTARVSKDSAQQRKGRTGRDRPGFCYRMCTEAEYEKYEQNRPDEITRIPLHTAILELLDSHFHPAFLLKNLTSVDNIERSMSFLEGIGVIQKSDSLSDVVKTSLGFPPLPTVNEVGSFVVKMPLSVRNGVFLYQWMQSGNLMYPGIVLAALVDCFGPSYFWWPRTKDPNEIEAHRQHFLPYKGSNELVSLAKMWNSLMTNVRGIYAKPDKIASHCWRHFLNHKKVREALITIRQCVDLIKEYSGEEIELKSFDEEEMIKLAIPFFQKCYYDRVMNAISKTAYKMPQKGSPRYILDVRRTISQTGSSCLISLSDITLIMVDHTISMISISLPLETDKEKESKEKESKENKEKVVDEKIDI